MGLIKPKWIILIFTILILSQISYGAFPSGWNNYKELQINSTQIYSDVNVIVNIDNITLSSSNCSQELRIANESLIETDFSVISNTSNSCNISFVIDYINTSNRTYRAYYNNPSPPSTNYNATYFEDSFTYSLFTDPRFKMMNVSNPTGGVNTLTGTEFQITGANDISSFWDHSNVWVTETNMTMPLYVKSNFYANTYNTGQVGIVSSIYNGGSFDLSAFHGLTRRDRVCYVVNVSSTGTTYSNTASCNTVSGATQSLTILNDTFFNISIINAGNTYSNSGILPSGSFGANEQFRGLWSSYYTGQRKDIRDITMVKGNYYTTFPTISIGSEIESGIILEFSFPPEENITSNILPYTEPFFFNITSTDDLATCILRQNGTIVNTTSYNITLSSYNNISQTWDNEVNYTTYNYSLYCNDSTNNITKEKSINILIDEQSPIINIYSPIASNRYSGNISMNVTFEDDNLYLANWTIYYPNSSMFYYNYSGVLTETFYEFIETIDFSGEPLGTYQGVASGCDGHTKYEIKPIKVAKDILKKEIKFNDKIKVSLKSDQSITQINTEQLKDRVTFEYKTNDKSKKEQSYIFNIVSDSPIVYLPDSGYDAHFIIDKYWADFELEDKTDETYKIKKINDYEYEITITSSKSNLKFKSIGELNCESKNVSFILADVDIDFYGNSPSNATIFKSADVPYTIDFTVDIDNYVESYQTCNLRANGSIIDTKYFNTILTPTITLSDTYTTDTAFLETIYSVDCNDSYNEGTDTNKTIYTYIETSRPTFTFRIPRNDNTTIISLDYPIINTNVSVEMDNIFNTSFSIYNTTNSLIYEDSDTSIFDDIWSYNNTLNLSEEGLGFFVTTFSSCNGNALASICYDAERYFEYSDLSLNFYNNEPYNGSNILYVDYPYTATFTFQAVGFDNFITCNLSENGIVVNQSLYNISGETLFNISRTYDTQEIGYFEYNLICNDSLRSLTDDDKTLFLRIVQPTLRQNFWSLIANVLGEQVFGNDGTGKAVLGIIFILFIWFITVILGFSVWNQAILTGMMAIALATSQYVESWVTILWVIFISFVFGLLFTYLFKD